MKVKTRKVPEEQLRALRQRWGGLLSEDEQALRDKLLRMGGGFAIIRPGERDVFDLLESGERFDGKAEMRLGESNQCHLNAAKIYMADIVKYAIGTGYALSSDGLWRQHSWAFHVGSRDVLGRPIETTEERVLYFGLVLRDAAAVGFVLGQVSAEEREEFLVGTLKIPRADVRKMLARKGKKVQ